MSIYKEKSNDKQIMASKFHCSHTEVCQVATSVVPEECSPNYNIYNNNS